MSIVKCAVAAAVTLLALPILLSAQKPVKPPKPGGTAPNPSIAYELGRNGSYDLMVMDADGRNQTRLVRGGRNMTPSWSPDGEWIAFARTAVTNPGIYMIRRNGSGLCRIVATTGTDRFGAPTWSPVPTANKSYKIIYVEQAEGATRPDLFGVDAVCGATDPQRLTDTPTLYERSPAWSADNVLAAGVGEVGLSIQLYDIVVDNLGGITLSPSLNLTTVGPLAGGDVSDPTWTQDRSELVVIGSLDFRPDLWVISATAPGIARQLNQTATLLEQRPTWSPDFAKLAYAGFGGVGALYTVDVDTNDWTLSAPRVLLDSTQGSVGHPSWRPIQ